MKVGTDAVLLGAWVEVNPSDWVLDIGTGCGILPLMLAQKGIAKVHAVDLDEASALEAAGNFDASQWRRQLFAFHGDIRHFDLCCKYDLIISNPPFFSNSFKCDADRKNQARHTDVSLTFQELLHAVKRLMKPDGRLTVVLPAKKSVDFLAMAERYHLYVHRQQDLIPVEGREVNRVNLELRFGAPTSVELTSLVMRHQDNSLTDAYHDFLKDYYLG